MNQDSCCLADFALVAVSCGIVRFVAVAFFDGFMDYVTGAMVARLARKKMGKKCSKSYR